MITLTAKINLLSGDNSALTLSSDNLSGNNISLNLSGIVGFKKNGSNPFIIGASKLGDGSTFSDGEDYFIGDRLSDKKGSFTNAAKYEYKTVSHTINVTRENLLFRYGGSGGGFAIATGGAVLLTNILNNEEQKLLSINFNPTNVTLLIDNSEVISSLDGNNNYNSTIGISQPIIDSENNISVGLVVTCPIEIGYPIWEVGYNLSLSIQGTLEIEYRVLTEQAHTPYEITINSTKELKSLTIAFDTVNNRHPKKIQIDKLGLKAMSRTNMGDGYIWYTWVIEIEEPTNYSLTAVYSPNGREIPKYSAANMTHYYELNGITYESGALRCSIRIPEYAEGVFGIGSKVFPYATFEINGVLTNQAIEYIDDDAIFTLSNLEPSFAYKIIIEDWNTPNYPLVITGIYAEVSIDIDRRNLISISHSIFDRSDLKLPSWGIISNTGNIEFNDTDGEILDYAEQLLLQSGLKCEIFLNNTLENAQERIGLFETDEWDYDNDNRVVSVSIKDDLEEWQDINVAEISYDPREIESKPFKWLYVYLWKLTSNRYYAEESIYGNGNYDMLAFDELDTGTQDILKNTYTQYPLLESGSLWEEWTKLCEVCQLHIYKDNNGVVVCRYNGGN